MLIFNIEQGTARSTCARTGRFCFLRAFSLVGAVNLTALFAWRDGRCPVPIIVWTTQRSSLQKRSNSAFFLVDRPLRRAMLNPLGFADIFNIERAASAMLRRAKGTARSIAN